MNSLILNILLCVGLSAVGPGPEGNLQEAGAEVKLDRARPIDYATEINSVVGRWYAAIESNPGAFVATESKIDCLRAWVETMAEIEPAITANYSSGIRARENATTTRQRMAMGWLHAWAIMSRMARDLSEYAIQHPEESLEVRRAKLLGLDANGADSSALKRLLGLLETIVAHQEKGTEPFRVLLQDAAEAGLRVHLRYYFAWRPDEERSEIPHPWYVPALGDLMGQPGDAPELQRGLFSVWSLVNLQLDRWRGPIAATATAPARPDLGGLAAWLEKLGNSGEITMAFDHDHTQGADFRARAKKLHRFMRFRGHCLDETDFQKLLGALQALWSKDESIASAKTDLGLDLADLIEAARPLGDENGETLPHAEILLRYIVLMSFRDKGTDAVASTLGKAWGGLDLKRPFIDLPRYRQATHSPSAFVRWNEYPPEHHFARALGDATLATYHYAVWQTAARHFEQERYLGAYDPRRAEPIRAQARERAREIGRIRHDAARAGEVLSGSASQFERDWLQDDLRALSDRLRESSLLQDSIARAYESNDASVIATALQSPGSLFGDDAWNPNALPDKTFAQYAEDLDRASKLLRNEALDFLNDRDIKEQYNEARIDLDIARVEFQAAKFGLDAAEKGTQVAALYQKIAKLQGQMAELLHQASLALVESADLELKTGEKKLEMATRVRDLAAAELEALQASFKEAEKMVKQAQNELEAMKPRLLEAAKKIKDERKKSGLFGFIKAIINVVGLALAPFTGGASVAIATLASQAVSVVEKAEKMDWGNFSSVVQNVGDIAGDAAKLADQTIGQFGGPELQKSMAEFKTWVNDAKGEIDKIGNQAKQVLDSLKGLDKTLIGPVATALLNELPVRVEADGKTVKVSFEKPKLKLEGELNRILAELLKTGGVVVSDARARLKGLAHLPGSINDPEYQSKLKKAVDDLIVAMPDDLLAKVNGDVEAAKSAVAKLKGDLQKEIAKGDKSTNELLAKVFGGGLIVTVAADNSGQIVVLERPIKKELEAFKARIKAFERSVVNKALTEVADRCGRRIKDLSDQSKEAQKDKNDKALEELAASIPSRIEGLQKELDELTGKIAEAQGKLDDAELGVEIATLHRDSLKFKLTAAGHEERAAALGKEVAQYEEMARALQVEQSELVKLQHGLLVEARRYNLDAAEARLRHIDQLGRLYGYDLPNWRAIEDAEHSRRHPRLLETLSVKTTKDAMREAWLVDRLTRAYIGELQWIRLLDARTAPQFQEDPVGVFGRLLDSVTLARSNAPTEFKALEFVRRSDVLNEMYGTLAPKWFRVRAQQFSRMSLTEYDLRLMPPLNDPSGIPTEGKSLIIVGIVGQVLHFRIFDGDGKMVEDTDVKMLAGRARTIEDFSRQLEGLWPPHALAESEKVPLIAAVKSIFGKSDLNRGAVEWLVKQDDQATFQFDDVVASGELDQLTPELRSRVLGRFTVRFSTDPLLVSMQDARFLQSRVVPGDRSYLFFLDQAFMVRTAPNDVEIGAFRFVMVPNSAVMVNNTIPMAATPPRNEDDTDIIENSILNTVLHDLETDLGLKRRRLRGALGEWVVYILSTGVGLDETARKTQADIARRMTVSLYVPYLEIRESRRVTQPR
jgi:hypothetical protein